MKVERFMCFKTPFVVLAILFSTTSAIGQITNTQCISRQFPGGQAGMYQGLAQSSADCPSGIEVSGQLRTVARSHPDHSSSADATVSFNVPSGYVAELRWRQSVGGITWNGSPGLFQPRTGSTTAPLTLFAGTHTFSSIVGSREGDFRLNSLNYRIYPDEMSPPCWTGDCRDRPSRMTIASGFNLDKIDEDIDSERYGEGADPDFITGWDLTFPPPLTGNAASGMQYIAQSDVSAEQLNIVSSESGFVFEIGEQSDVIPAIDTIHLPQALPGGGDQFEIHIDGVVYPVSANQFFDVRASHPTPTNSFFIAGFDKSEGIDYSLPAPFTIGISVDEPGWHFAASAPLVLRFRCDFDEDDLCRVGELNQLLANGPFDTPVAVVEGVNDQFDIATDENDETDGFITDEDVDAWLSAAAFARDLEQPIVPGDANLDGRVDSADLNRVGLSWQRDDATSWGDGDFNFDGRVDSADLNQVGLNWQYGVAQPAAVVPEPGGYAFWLGVVLLLARSKMGSSPKIRS